MKSFDCPKCGAPVSYEPNAFGATRVRCAYCNSQLQSPDEAHGLHARVIDINIGPEVRATASKAIWLMVLIPLVIAGVVIGGIFAAIVPLMRSGGSRTTPTMPSSRPGSGPSGSRASEPANSFANVTLRFGSEGIGPGMMTDARSIAVDGKGNIYVGEYIGGRVQVFDASGNFVTQWMVDTKMPLRGLAADRKGTVYVVQKGAITRYEGENGKALGAIDYGEGWGFDDVILAPDGGLVCAWYKNRDDIVRFNSEGRVVQTIRAAISTPADRSELNTRVAIDGLGNIYALGSFTNGVFKFSPEGKFLNRFGSAGEQPGQFRAPHAIAVDGKGRVLVSDIKGVQVFDSDGRYITVFKPEGSAFGMVFNNKNELFIAARNKVLKFALKE